LGLKNTTSDQGRRQPQLGPAKKTFRGAHMGENFRIFWLFKTAHSGVLYIFKRRRGAQTSRSWGRLR